MLVRMRVHITGYRDGEPWPAVGGTIDVPDGEAADLVANQYAEPVGGNDAGSPAATIEATDDGPTPTAHGDATATAEPRRRRKP